MKKLLILVAGIAGMSLSMNASAAAIAGVTGGSTTSISTTDCTLLTEGVSINLSTDVTGGYSCNATTNVIAFATCHPNGRKVNTDQNYIYAGSSAGGSVGADPNNYATCDTAGTAADGVAVTVSGAGTQ